MILKINRNGDTLWSKIVYQPDSINERCFAYGIIETNDKGFLIYGREGGTTGVMIKTDSVGSKEWLTYFGTGQISDARLIFSVCQTVDSGFITGGDRRNLAAVKSGDPLVTKFDKNGIKKWEKAFGSQFEDYPGAYIQPIDEANFLVITHYTIETSGKPYYHPIRNQLQIVGIDDGGSVFLNMLKGPDDQYIYLEDIEMMECLVHYLHFFFDNGRFGDSEARELAQNRIHHGWWATNVKFAHVAGYVDLKKVFGNHTMIITFCFFF